MGFKIIEKGEVFFEDGKLDLASVHYNDSTGVSQQNVPSYEIFCQELLNFLEPFSEYDIWLINRYEGHNMKLHDSQYNRHVIHMAELGVIDVTFASGGTNFSNNPNIKFQKISYWLGKNTDQNQIIGPRTFDKHFLYMNRLDKIHRQVLFQRVEEKNLLDYCIWSYAAADKTHPKHKTIEGITIDYEESYRETHILPEYLKTFCSIVTESQYGFGSPYESHSRASLCAPFPTEKTEKCFVAGQPFISVSTPYFLKQLRAWGFQTFGDFWDESYDEEIDDDKRLDKILEVMEYISSLPLSQLEQMYIDMKPKLIVNQKLNNEFMNKNSNRGFHYVDEIPLNIKKPYLI